MVYIIIKYNYNYILIIMISWLVIWIVYIYNNISVFIFWILNILKDLIYLIFEFIKLLYKNYLNFKINYYKVRESDFLLAKDLAFQKHKFVFFRFKYIERVNCKVYVKNEIIPIYKGEKEALSLINKLDISNTRSIIYNFISKHSNVKFLKYELYNYDIKNSKAIAKLNKILENKPRRYITVNKYGVEKKDNLNIILDDDESKKNIYNPIIDEIKKIYEFNEKLSLKEIKRLNIEYPYSIFGYIYNRFFFWMYKWNYFILRTDINKKHIFEYNKWWEKRIRNEFWLENLISKKKK